jgi:hypothetical protein
MESTDSVSVFNLKNYCFDETGVLLHLAVGDGGLFGSGKRHRFKPKWN